MFMTSALYTYYNLFSGISRIAVQPAVKPKTPRPIRTARRNHKIVPLPQPTPPTPSSPIPPTPPPKAWVPMQNARPRVRSRCRRQRHRILRHGSRRATTIPAQQVNLDTTIPEDELMVFSEEQGDAVHSIHQARRKLLHPWS